MSLPDLFIKDLAKSGLDPSDMDIRKAGIPELSTLGLPSTVEGYIIPYYDHTGKLRPFYRTKLFNHSLKYKQAKDTANHVYFPRDFGAAARTSDVCIICEGEKKAALLVKHGIAACALGGVDSWKNRTIILPKGSDIGASYAEGKDLTIRLPAGDSDIADSHMSPLALGLMDLVYMAVNRKMHIIIAYDTDSIHGIKYEVQRAAALLAFELRFLGIPYGKIHQLTLPAIPAIEKTAVDDYIVSEGIEAFQELIVKTLTHPSKTFFPRHPNPSEFIKKALQKTNLPRDKAMKTSLAVLSDLDSRGQRLRSDDGGMLYYFDHDKKTLIKAMVSQQNKSAYHSSDFGQLLYNKYLMSAADGRILTWLEVQFYGEEPIHPVRPYRVISRPELDEDCIRYQLNDGQYVKVTKDGVQILDNGTDGYLFESGYTEPISSKDLKEEIEKQRRIPLKPWWTGVLDEARLKKDVKNQTMIAMLFYLNPWLYKWRGMQLPVEIILGESGSGKSSLYEHRLNILTGRPELRNTPEKLKDWHASISNSGGLHVTDNVQLLDKGLRQRLSDEICRLVTEPYPHIEMRKLYSDNENIRIPINTTFAITAIQQPFYQADVLQRSIVIELDKQDSVRDEDLSYSANWVDEQMTKFGGRTAWVVHHLLAVEKFFQVAHEDWNPNYRASHRLNNLEQSLVMMGKVFDIDMSWLPGFLALKNVDSVSGSDWCLQGLKEFAETFQHEKSKEWKSADIAAWAMTHADYMECHQLTNTRALGRYIQSHKQLVAQIAKLHAIGKRNNAEMYMIK